MKEIRIIKRAVSVPMSYDEFGDENNNESKIFRNFDAFGAMKRRSGFFNLAVRPMLAPGHESELVYFMQSIGLIQQYMLCGDCGKSMKWTPSKINDLFQWKCLKCEKKTSIRENSPISEVKCSFKNVLLTLFAWSKNADAVKTSKILDVKKSIVSALYSLAGSTVEKYIHSNLSQWKIGGPSVLVLVDTFPEGCTSDVTQCSRPILCLAELKGVPPNMWFQALERNSRNSTVDVNQLNKSKCLEVVEALIHPESIVIARRDSTLCSYDDLKKFEHKFKILVSTEGLARHDREEENLMDNLCIIWQEALNVCTAAQDYHDSLVQSFLYSYMWRRRFGDESFQILLNEISRSVM